MQNVTTATNYSQRIISVFMALCGCVCAEEIINHHVGCSQKILQRKDFLSILVQGTFRKKHSERNIHMFWKLQTRGIYGGDQEGYFLEGKKEPESQ